MIESDDRYASICKRSSLAIVIAQPSRAGENSMKVKGIKRGQVIELLQELDLPDGSEIMVELELPERYQTPSLRSLTQVEKLARLNQLFGAWQDQPELVKVCAEIDLSQSSSSTESKNVGAAGA
jgi:hypothetical protein